MLPSINLLFTLLIACYFIVSAEGYVKKDVNTAIVINTWAFTNATEKAWEVLSSGGSSLDAVELGCSVCEAQQCDGSVGYGGSPDENGETTLDALIMDGETFNVGAVGSMKRVKSAISVARKVLENTKHSILVGESATKFAVQMGFKEESLSTQHSQQMYHKWKNNTCQPNYWTNVTPEPTMSCGPYQPFHFQSTKSRPPINEGNHDTIGMVAVDINGNVAAGTSTNGASYKIPGRMGDSPIPGAGAYADKSIGAAAATGDGDIMLRFLPSFHVLEEVRRGIVPAKAAELVIRKIKNKYPDFQGAVIVLRIDGKYGAACHGWETFPYSVRNVQTGDVIVEKVKCLHQKL